MQIITKSHNYVNIHTNDYLKTKERLLILTFSKYFCHTSILCISTATYTQSNRSSNVSPSISCVPALFEVIPNIFQSKSYYYFRS